MGSRSSYLRRFLRGLGHLAAGRNTLENPPVYSQDGGFRPAENVAPVGSGGSIYLNYAEPLSHAMHVTPPYPPIGTGGSTSGYDGAYNGFLRADINYGPAIKSLVVSGKHPGLGALGADAPYYLAQPTSEDPYGNVTYDGASTPQPASGAGSGYSPGVDYGATQAGVSANAPAPFYSNIGSKIVVTTEGQGGPLDFFKGTIFGLPRWLVFGVGAAVAYKASKGRF